MSTYDLEEQEQLAELKAFWRLYGNLIVLAVAAALAVFAGYRIWHWYQASQASQASARLCRAAEGRCGERREESAGPRRDPDRAVPALGVRAARRLHLGEGPLRRRRSQDRARAARVGGRECARSRRAGARAAAARQRHARRPGLRRGAEGARRETGVGVRGAVRGRARRRAGRTGQAGGGEGRLLGGARQAEARGRCRPGSSSS